MGSARMEPAYMEDLALMFSRGCQCGDCKKMAEFIRPRCHPKSGMQFKLGDGFLNVICDECEKHVIRIAVARRK